MFNSWVAIENTHWYVSTQRYIILDKCSPFIQVYRQADEDEDVHDSNGLLIVVGAKKNSAVWL